MSSREHTQIDGIPNELVMQVSIISIIVCATVKYASCTRAAMQTFLDSSCGEKSPSCRAFCSSYTEEKSVNQCVEM